MNRITRRQARRKFGVDSNGRPTETMALGGQEIVVHYDDIPESDITTVHGLRVTTALRTVIDIAPDYEREDLERVVNDCLERRLFTLEEATERLSRPDMTSRRGAAILRHLLHLDSRHDL